MQYFYAGQSITIGISWARFVISAATKTKITAAMRMPVLLMMATTSATSKLFNNNNTNNKNNQNQKNSYQ